MAETPKSQEPAPTAIEESEKKSAAVPPTMSGKQPSPFTELRQNSSSRLGQQNCDMAYTRQEFYSLLNRAISIRAAPPLRAMR